MMLSAYDQKLPVNRRPVLERDY
jgi:hypothetical protein